MRLSKIISFSAVGTCALAQNSTTGQLGDAVAVTNNPVGKSAIAELPEEPFFAAGSLNGNVKGSVKATTGARGAGVDYEVTFSNLPAEGGPFTYHLHVDPVDATGNCTNTLAHLDPFIRGEVPACDPSKPATCQVGDLSGKYGKITSDPFTAKFHDDFTAMSEGPGSYFLNRSIVVHFANKTRITCANFAVLTYPNNATATSSSYQQTPTSTPPPISAGLSVKDGSSVGLAVLSMIAMFLAF
ncbi:putative superoxide dismutase [Rosellinia necatrix]|uniref:superoxide dismutase n=1 Tax=Rosellinia necatrix TaxID=77044 RepID=A0A1W2TB90_ROSNE|nr:putative superoxide dismutase [Rosellinia necatrix]